MASTLTDTLRAALAAAPSRYSVSMKTNIPQSVLSRFMHGGDLRLVNADKLAAYFGLTLRRERTRIPGGSR